MSQQRHNCGHQGWSHCCSCDGRIHEEGCTTRKNKQKDCCPERHKMLYDQGHKRGLFDESLAMWSEEHPWGYHDPVKNI